METEGYMEKFQFSYAGKEKITDSSLLHSLLYSLLYSSFSAEKKAELQVRHGLIDEDFKVA
jgi:hypothetical protein